MKTAISIPNQVFAQAEEFADECKMSRSALFTAAVIEFIQNHRKESVTEKLNKVYEKEESYLDSVLDGVQTLSLPREEW
jgi:metal-responsive CopG/Arc/MetJ family transcriptional regulator